MNVLQTLEAESIYALREIRALFKRPVILYSIGKDSSVLLHLMRKAFYPEKVPFTLLHVDTGYKFPEMYEFRSFIAKQLDLDVQVFGHQQAISEGASPYRLGTVQCCSLLKTGALRQALIQGSYDCAIGGARRDEEKSRAKERFFSIRDSHGQWDPKNQRPEVWQQYNGHLAQGESMRAFPLSNWTELDIWHYIYQEGIPVVPLYFSKLRSVIRRGAMILPVHDRPSEIAMTENVEMIWCRYRSLGCMPCSGAFESRAATIPDIIQELLSTKNSERASRIIDHSSEQALEQKKREGYF